MFIKESGHYIYYERYAELSESDTYVWTKYDDDDISRWPNDLSLEMASSNGYVFCYRKVPDGFVDPCHKNGDGDDGDVGEEIQ
jgi:hypothetical protein